MVLDSWHGLSSPSRGLAMRPHYLPAVVQSRNMSPSTRRRLTAAGSLTPVRRGVLAPPIDPTSAVSIRLRSGVLQQARAVHVTAHTDFAFSHQTAALLLGCWVLHPRLPIHITRPGYSSTTAHARQSLIRHDSAIDPRMLRLHGDCFVTCLERTVFDCIRTLPWLEALAIADSALRIGASRELLTTLLDGAPGVRGIRQAREVLASATDRVHSPGESLVRGVAIRAGLAAPSTLHPVATDAGPAELDLAWESVKVAVEFDGAMKVAGLTGEQLTRHVNALATREAALARAGWLVLHLTWDDLRNLEKLRTRLVRLVRHRVLR